MKKSVLLAGILAMSLWAVDYSQMTTEQLLELRGSVPIEDRDAFRTEMQSRLQTMTPEELAAFRASRQMSPTGMQGRGGGAATAPTFAELDTDGNGKISQTELDAARAARMEARAADGRLLTNAASAPSFETLDTNKDGFVDANEFQIQQQAQMQSHMESRGQNMRINSQAIQQRVQDGSAAGQMLRGVGRGHGRP